MFTKGISGNPAGCPRGSRHKVTLFAEKLMASGAEDIFEAVVKAARNGDMMAAKIVLDRLVPVRRGNPVSFDLPKMKGPADGVAAYAAILNAVAVAS